MSSSLLPQLSRMSCSLNLDGRKVPEHLLYFVGSCFPNVFNITHRILVQFPSIIFSRRFVSVHVVHPYSSIDSTTPQKKPCFKTT